MNRLHKTGKLETLGSDIVISIDNDNSLTNDFVVGNREKSHGGWNGAASSDFHRLDNGQTYAKEEPAIP